MGAAHCIQAAPPSPRRRVSKERLSSDDRQRIVVKTDSDLTKDVARITSAFRLGREIGRSGTARVLQVVHKQSKQRLAMKTMEKQKEESSKLVEQEVSALKQLDHPNVLKFLGLWTDNRNYYIVTRLCAGGDLAHQLSSLQNRRMPENSVKFFIRCILSAMSHAHSVGIIHRDLKPEHIMFESRSSLATPIIIDWGDALIIQDHDTIDRKDFAGTPDYMCPEIARDRFGWEGKKSDVWAIAVTAYVLLFGKTPFTGANMKLLFQNIQYGSFVLGIGGVCISADAEEFLKKCLAKDPALRCSASEALELAWFG